MPSNFQIGDMEWVEMPAAGGHPQTSMGASTSANETMKAAPKKNKRVFSYPGPVGAPSGMTSFTYANLPNFPVESVGFSSSLDDADCNRGEEHAEMESPNHEIELLKDKIRNMEQEVRCARAMRHEMESVGTIEYIRLLETSRENAKRYKEALKEIYLNGDGELPKTFWAKFPDVISEIN